MDCSSRLRYSKGRMDDEVDDFMLMEILGRIPCAKTLTRCKSVSKRWLSVISSPYFLCKRFSLHPNHDHDHRGSTTDPPPPPPSLFLFTGQGSAFMSGTGSPKFKSISDSFPFGAAGLRILASCNDLLLCAFPTLGDNSRMLNSFRGPYYILNPFTTQRRETVPPLPPPPQGSPDYIGSFGLISYRDDPNTLATGIGTRIRYKVVFLRAGTRQEEGLVANVFCSETRNWTSNYTMQTSTRKGMVIGIGAGSTRSGLFVSSTATLNGSLYFLPQLRSNNTHIIAYDPSLDRFRIVEMPPPPPISSMVENWACLGVCRGALQIFSLQSDWDPNTVASSRITLTVWELEDEESGQWNRAKERGLEGEVFLNETSIGWQRSCCPLAIHPTEPHTVFVQFSHSIESVSEFPWSRREEKPPAVPRAVVCSINLETKEIKAVGEIREWGRLLGFPVQLPWWPTPVPVCHRYASFYIC